MADNINLNAGSGGDTVRTLDRGGVETQVMAVDVGGAAGESLLGPDNPMPVDMGTVVYLLAAILDKLPRMDANDRLVINTSDQGNVTIAVAAAQTLAAVTTVTGLTTANDLLRLNNFGVGATARAADAVPLHIANMGASHLYDRITF
jgi:hypothetical protein